MTNLDYIKTLGAEEMAKLICWPDQFLPTMVMYGWASKHGAVLRWLEQEHEEGEGK